MSISRLDEETLYKSALHYLERYAATADGVRQVLQRKMQRAERAGIVVDKSLVYAAIEAVVAKLQGLGYVNDALFAEAKLASLRRGGTSAARVRQKLALKGVSPDVIAEVMAKDESDDKTAAVAFAKKRRLGPFALPAIQAARQQQHLAALARAGFSFAIAQWVVQAESVEALLETLSD